MLDCVGGPVFSVDHNYCYTSFNKNHSNSMKKLYGAEIRIGTSMLNYHTNPEDRKEAKKNIDRAFRGENVTIESFAGEEITVPDISLKLLIIL